MAGLVEYWTDLVKPAMNNAIYEMAKQNETEAGVIDGGEAMAMTTVADKDGRWTAELTLRFEPSAARRERGIAALAKHKGRKTRDGLPDGEPA